MPISLLGNPEIHLHGGTELWGLSQVANLVIAMVAIWEPLRNHS